MSYSGPWDIEYIDALYGKWKADPGSVGKDWSVFFDGFELGYARSAEPDLSIPEDRLRKQSRVEALIYRYRDIGHLLSCLDPLVSCVTDHPLLNPKAFGLTREDMTSSFYVPGAGTSGHKIMTLKEILSLLRTTYCRSIGVEYMHLQDPSERGWLREKMESCRNKPDLSRDEKIRILQKLCETRRFEQFLHKKYIGQKRFSLEGADAVIPMLDALVNHASGLGCKTVVLGMAHRGRLNVMTNILNRPYEDIFRKFENQFNPNALAGAGDVKYHEGYSAQITLPDSRRVMIVLPSNPSHLESVDPVVEGMARAFIDMKRAGNYNSVLPVLLHGDAAFAGQGIVAETLNMSQLEGYKTGGTIHVIVNNQIGYTTLPEDARSTRYSTDIAKGLMVPIFHVHGESPDALIGITKLACEYRMRFNKDVIIDVIGYRRYGHNEGDEPYFTQPLMYERIKTRPSLDEIYGKLLIEEEVIDRKGINSINKGIDACLSGALNTARKTDAALPPTQNSAQNDSPDADTRIEAQMLTNLARAINSAPAGFNLHPKIKKLFEKRLAAVDAGNGIDWANAEALAFGAILARGIPIRLSGEDSQRGTFSQRHSVVFDMETNAVYAPLAHADKKQGLFTPINSLLSEAGVLGFEYGYSLVRPDCLTIWEAQFGDFVNNAQVIIDQYIVSGGTKWGVKSGLVLLLPHGYEGQGPEHSSARPERFLALCADDNLGVCYPTTPAQYFHILCRQAMGPILKPLVIFTPKSLLRNPLATSEQADFTKKGFLPIISDNTPAKTTKRVLFCTGKIYYELKTAAKDKNVALVRIEQLYPFPGGQIKKVIKKYKNCGQYTWVQEEPQNMGAWGFMQERFKAALGIDLDFIGRKASSTPATGFYRLFLEEQQGIIRAALD
ncbi:MAG: 2-oxoglutarate dehydrogenase E1 component [Deltaproteobacteria bacterium]|nr:2-oxoglutarate dehydrogenase E1 component [Deltaproteobacteria bacterium]